MGSIKKVLKFFRSKYGIKFSFIKMNILYKVKWSAKNIARRNSKILNFKCLHGRKLMNAPPYVLNNTLYTDLKL